MKKIAIYLFFFTLRKNISNRLRHNYFTQLFLYVTNTYIDFTKYIYFQSFIHFYYLFIRQKDMFRSIPDMFLKVCSRFNQKNVYMIKSDGKYKGITFAEFKEKVFKFALGLLDAGVRKSDRIGIVSENRLEWAIADYATTIIGAIDVPIFPTLTSKQEEFIFSDCSVTAIIVSNKFQLNKVMQFKDNLKSLRHVIVMNDDFESFDLAVKPMKELIQRGEALYSNKRNQDILYDIIDKVQPDDLLTLIYTSGTTGNPKGVMLSHENVISNVVGAVETVGIYEQDMFLSYLPWCHAFERTTGYYAAFSVGATVALAESIETVVSNLKDIQPTVMTTVPKFLETAMKKIKFSIDRDKPSKQRVFKWAEKVGKNYIETKLSDKHINLVKKARYKLADNMVFSKIRSRFGNNLRLFCSGGAALPPDVCEFFLATGVLIIEGYGLTEASPVVSVNIPEHLEIGTIGRPLTNVNIKLAEDGELLVKSKSVMVGYWNDPQATQEAVDAEGWLHTGDICTITEKGNIKVIDRKKHILVSSGGKNIAPLPIENVLQQSIFIDQIFLVGDNREYITALITPDFEQLKVLAESLQIKYYDYTDLITNQAVQKVIKNDIDRLQKDFAKFERVRKFTLLPKPFTVESGELTPKLSIKRHVVESKYSNLIDEMYGV